MSTDSEQLGRSPTHLLHRAQQCAEAVFEAGTKDTDLTPRQLAVLVVVALNEGLSQTGIVEHTGVDRSTVADMVKRLQKKGLLQRRRTKADARAYAVKLTDKGQRVLRVGEPVARKVDNHILEALPTQRREGFIKALQSVVNTLEGLSPR
jgi:DNA-binding MarR family transcriptional regulator